MESHQLASLATSDLAGAIELKYLHLDSNMITSVAEDAFTDTTNLVFVSLRENLIKSILPGTFSKLAKLMYLDMSNNAMTQYDGRVVTAGLASLRYLNLAANPIASVACRSFENVASTLNFL
jgi:Leucine-rich repeat (LRR) protein